MLAAVLARHNQARGDLGIAPLVLDTDLNRQALAYARQLADTNTFQHSAASDRPGQGENLWAGTASRFSYEQMANGWINEKQYFVYDRFPYNSTTGNWADVGHYTQIIWKNTTRLGCGIATANNRDVLVCRYAPQGNIVGQFPY